MSAYIKRKSDNKIIFSCSGQSINTPAHLTALELFLTSRSLLVADYTIADATEEAVSQMIEDAETNEEKAQVSIQNLEATITPRRLRDALANDAGKSWVAAVEAKIATERGKL